MSNPSVNERKPTNSGIPPIGDKDFPGLYQRADQAAIRMQRYYFCLYWLYLFLLIFGSTGAAFASMIPEAFSAWVHGGITIVLTIGILIHLGSRVLKHDEKWFECRVIAESAKNATWRFMMKTTPFENDSTAEETFMSKIKKIREQRQSGLDSLAPHKNLEAKLISNFMRNVREKCLEDRKEYYFEFRLRDQRTWYSKKAGYNARNKSHWLTITMSLQGLAIIFSIMQFILSWPVNLVPILMTCAAASIAWTRMKRHSELAQSYTMVVHEFEELEIRASSVTQESEFRKFVNDVEYAISREHTMWYVRRDVIVNN